MAKSDKRKEEIKKEKMAPCCGGAGLIPGIAVLTLGVLLLLSDMKIISFGAGFILLTIGFVFLLVYATSRVWAFLIPGVILFGIGVLIYLNLEDLGYLYPLIVGLSFIAVYITRQEHTGWAIIPGGILLAVSVISAFEQYSNIDSWPLIVIGIGIYLLYKHYKK
ncbi:Uncharacterised protein [Candidatus Tiddalikarchaeum anstoanum]|nr:Uncharacterised protein [Candidatus Tiddalikarchaeum anstoanum]